MLVEYIKKKTDKLSPPTLMITHTIRDTMVEIDNIPSGITKNNDEMVIGEFCRYINCQFIITLHGNNTIYFDECEFIDCVFYYAPSTENGDLNIEFTSCSINNMKFRSGTYESIHFIRCNINGIQTEDNKSMIRCNRFKVYQCYEVFDIELPNSVIVHATFIDNMRYDKINLVPTTIDDILFKDRHLYKYWKEEFQYDEGTDFIYERIGVVEDGKKKK